ncbi:MAG TPA: glycosyltransferase family A protein [Terriglobales bacterium]|nr:glycosyltransferase family A protein [Terriglobales bacterium]
MSARSQLSDTTPTVTVIMPAQNEERYIGAAIESVLGQTYDRWELVVVDDHSTDRTAEIVRSFNDSRIRLYQKSTEPPGRALSRNIGISMARGSFIAYHDADDYSRPTRIELQVKEALAGIGPRAVGTWVEQLSAAGPRIRELPTSHDQIVAGFGRRYKRVTIVAGTLLLPRSVAVAIPLRVRFRYLEDWDQLCRIHEAQRVEFRNVPQVLYIYNIRPKGSKCQQDWACYNVFERACRARRQAGLMEWDSLEQFEAYLAGSTREFLYWRTFRQLLRLKANIEMRLAGSLAPTRTWHLV